MVCKVIDMTHRLRLAKEDESGLGHVFERMVNGMRNEMNIVLLKIERSRDMSPEALKVPKHEIFDSVFFASTNPSGPLIHNLK